MNEILTINKPRGISPLQAIEIFKQKFPSYQAEKISYAGRLDPMADGILLLLVGEQNKKRREFESLPKTYEFQVLLGITTDTYDSLGLITSISSVPENTLTHFTETLRSFIGKRKQLYPAYSSMHVAGKPLFFWAREGKLNDIEIPSREVVIESLKQESLTRITSKDLVAQAIKSISLVKGDFRQDAIITSWQEVNKSELTFPVITCKATVSSGTYIRSLAHELGQRLKTGAIAYSITRTEVGKWKLQDAISLTEHL